MQASRAHGADTKDPFLADHDFDRRTAAVRGCELDLRRRLDCTRGDKVDSLLEGHGTVGGGIECHYEELDPIPGLGRAGEQHYEASWRPGCHVDAGRRLDEAPDTVAVTVYGDPEVGVALGD